MIWDSHAAVLWASRTNGVVLRGPHDSAGRRISSTYNGLTTQYRYNALGQRVRKSPSTASNDSYDAFFVYDESGHLLGEYTSTGALIEETIWLNDTPVATLRPASGGVTIYYVHTDHLNTPAQITRPSDNTVMWRWDQIPFGRNPANPDPDGDGVPLYYNLRYPGQYHDAETGLFYNYFRDYDPATGRYTTSDPIGLAGGINTYAYALNDPLSRVDPTGENALVLRYFSVAYRAGGYVNKGYEAYGGVSRLVRISTTFSTRTLPRVKEDLAPHPKNYKGKPLRRLMS